jgi:hypothetical protein
MRAFFALCALVFLGSCSEPTPTYEEMARSMNMPLNIGPVCGNPDIFGIEIDDINGGSGRGCGVSNPVKVYMVSGVALRQQPNINCTTAEALNTWVAEDAQPLMAELKTRIESLQVIAHYSCRPRNNVRGARLSEHGKGNAVDIAGLTLADGTELNVLNDWRSAKASIMKALHDSACGPFGTVLGPAADRHHQNHFHFDVADYRSGPYCR